MNNHYLNDRGPLALDAGPGVARFQMIPGVPIPEQHKYILDN